MLPFFGKEVEAVLDELSETHRYLAAQGAITATEAALTNPDRYWGSQMKLTRVRLPDGGKPDCVPGVVSDHSLIEVINQCATLERLIDTLEWASTNLPEFTFVECCHPTTSSQKSGDTGDNDLILRSQNGECLRFEISDVASEKDGNGKEKKDLISLGILNNAEKAIDKTKIWRWPEGRLFLVVSSEFGKRLLKPKRHSAWLKDNHCHYVLVSLSGTTRIIEVCSGASSQHE